MATSIHFIGPPQRGHVLTVRIKKSASTEMRPGTLAAVCGMREVETLEQSQQFGCAIGTTLYLVEFGDGASVEIPEEFVEVANDDG